MRTLWQKITQAFDLTDKVMTVGVDMMPSQSEAITDTTNKLRERYSDGYTAVKSSVASCLVARALYSFTGEGQEEKDKARQKMGSTIPIVAILLKNVEAAVPAKLGLLWSAAVKAYQDEHE